MPTWRCPHCGTPQEETARCWVCRRSSTACGTCRNFRRSVAAQLGYCGLDRRRTPLAGDEIRGCWESSRIDAIGSDARPGVPVVTPVARAARLEFIEVGAIASPPGREADPATATEPERRVTAPPVPTSDPGWSLWGDADL